MFIAVTFNTNKHTHNSYAPVVPYFLGVWPEITDCSFRNNFVEIANRLTDALFFANVGLLIVVCSCVFLCLFLKNNI